jgi:hypothetical protein
LQDIRPRRTHGKSQNGFAVATTSPAKSGSSARCCVQPHFVLDIDNNRLYTTALGQRLLAGAPGCGPANQVHAMLARGLTAGAAGQ